MRPRIVVVSLGLMAAACGSMVGCGGKVNLADGGRVVVTEPEKMTQGGTPGDKPAEARTNDPSEAK